MGLEPLELLKGKDIGVLVVQVQDEADGDEIVFQVIEEGTTAGLHVKRPAEGVLDET
ncbi:hypothetical protein D3C73_539840 [compost metagenome]